MSDQLNANGSVITRGILAHALEMGGLLPTPPDMKDHEYSWKVHPAQKCMLTERAVAQLTVAHFEGGLPERKMTPWTVMGFRLETDIRLPKDEIQLWHDKQRLVVIKGLAVPPAVNEEPHVETAVVG
jgi:hypothetical protein